MDTPDSTTRVLIVDDSASVRHAARTLLEASGCTVVAVESGEEALRECSRGAFDVIVTDLTMPGLGGVQLCQVLRSVSQTAATPIVLLTAADHPRNRFWARNAGANAYLAKEAMTRELSATVRDLAHRAARGGTIRDVSALDRLSELFDRMLFAAVITADVHRLVEHVADRKRLGRALVELCSEIVDGAYVVLRTEGPDGPWASIAARGVLHAGDTAEIEALGVDPTRAEIFARGEVGREAIGNRVEAMIVAGGEPIGTLCAFEARGSRAGARDGETIALLARESSLVLHSAILAERARALAMTDALTGLANRGATASRLQHEVLRARRQKTPLSVVIGDVDHFKRVNDAFGHGVGDAVLRAVADALRGCVRAIDLAGRWGGEEFVVILPGAGEAGARIAAERLRASIERLPAFAAGPAGVTASFGIATFTAEQSAESLVACADAALYRAKARGRNRVEVDVRG